VRSDQIVWLRLLKSIEHYPDRLRRLSYARRAQVELPPLSEFERMRNNSSDRSRIVEPVIKILNS